MNKRIDLIGKRFGRLTVINYKGSKENHCSWLCRCDCGKVVLVRGGNLRNGSTTSCGCYHKERIMESNSTHSMSGSRTYTSWVAMRNRCRNSNRPDYRHYGGRGITICDSWLESFDSFLKDMGERPEGMSLDRIDVNGNYEPSNCRWATAMEQGRNTRRSKFILYNGKKKTISEWSREVDIRVGTIYRRIFILNWPVEKALTTKILKTQSRK